MLTLPRENWYASPELKHDTAEAPHVNLGAVGETKHDLWRSVEPGLDIGINPLIGKTPTAEINYLDSTLIGFLEENVLRFHITVHNVKFLQVNKSDQDLD